MARPLSKFGELKKVYVGCSNPEKDKIVQSTIDQIKALTQDPRIE